MNKKIVDVQQLSIQYKNVQAVNKLSFHINSNEIVAIIGPNGAGKTSTVECIAGLRTPTSGEVKVFGKTPHSNRNELYEKMSSQFQETNYPDKIKVKELCEYFAAFYKNPADWQFILEQLDLEKRANTFVNKLSGGEKRKLSILLALLPKPQFIILDEPTTGLDPEVRRAIWETLKNLQQMGTSILLVSHYLEEVDYLANRILFMCNGVKDFEGTIEEFRLYAKQQLAEMWHDQLSLEEMYSMLLPKKSILTLERVL